MVIFFSTDILKSLLILLTIMVGISACDRQATPQKRPNLSKMVLVPAGLFVMGSNKVDENGKQKEYGLVTPLYLDEHPERMVSLPEYYIDTYEVTNKQYKQFIQDASQSEPFTWSQNGYNLRSDRLQATNVEAMRWIASEYFKFDLDTRLMSKTQLLQAMRDDQAIKDSLPVSNVSWYEARAYCDWAGKRLPSEAEWEKAARGNKGLEFPWGDEWDTSQTNTGDDEEWENGIAPVGSYLQNKSPYGAYDMAGNVWEWVNDWYQIYPESQHESKDFGEQNKVIRGGGGGIGHYSLSVFYRSAMRSFALPTVKNGDVGFRCAWNQTANKSL